RDWSSDVCSSDLPGAVLGGGNVVTVSSAGKTYNATGWKIGWLIAPPEVLEAARAVKQYLTFGIGTPMQHAVARALRDHPAFLPENARTLAGRRDTLVDALHRVPARRSWSPLPGTSHSSTSAGSTAARGTRSLSTSASPARSASRASPCPRCAHPARPRPGRCPRPSATRSARARTTST